MRPLLELVADGAVHRLADVREELADRLRVSADERDMRTASSGKPIYRDRMDWARTDLVQAGLLEAVRRGHIVITPRGREALESGPAELDRSYLRRYAEFEAFLSRRTRSEGPLASGDWAVEADDVLAAASEFRERCLLAGRGLLLPSREIWKIETIESVFHNLIETPNLGPGTFAEKLQGQLADLPDEAYALTADALAVYLLYPADFLAPTKRYQVRQPLEWRGLAPEDPGIVDRAFDSPIGGAGMFYVQRRDLQLGFILAFARAARTMGGDLHDPTELARLADDVAIPHLIASATESVSARTVSGARNIVLSLLAPDYYEAIASTNHKSKVAARWADLAGPSTDLDRRLYEIRRSLTERYGEGFNYYTPELRVEWDIARPVRPRGRPPRAVSQANAVGIAEQAIEEAVSLEDLANRVHMTVDELERLEALLHSKKQVIIEGPPGSGKTFLAENFADYFSAAAGQVALVQFHQSYGYEDFIQGIRPRTDSGSISYALVDGIFKRFCDAARHADKNQRFVFIIDEINRGNVARIFGELMYCLEYRGRSVPLAGADAGAPPFSIPPNVYVIGTMNNTDRSLAQLDYALRRRFYFYRLTPVEAGRAPVLERWLAKQPLSNGARAAVRDLFVALNQRVTEILGPDFQVGHSYFMQAEVDSDGWSEALWSSAITPLLEEYLYNRHNREQLLQELRPEHLVESTVAADDVEERT
ncbi:MAG TPA: AAA family ATPase [Candidatus Dormibacteraeota bacterium]|jgi:MoxR-like ATPase|nr:AAA family ATPase [Candidatus Dormibacteraeota bacterium]